MDTVLDRVAYSIPEVCVATGMGRDAIYSAIRRGDLIARKWRNRTIVVHDDLMRYLNSLPAAATPDNSAA
jgi:hypothetical protein